LTFQELSEKPLRSTFVLTRLNHYINDVTTLVYSPPQAVTLPVDSEKDLVHVPGVAEPTLAFS
jgi:hypothetical protein